jgi:prevent-host-death family protein
MSSARGLTLENGTWPDETASARPHRPERNYNPGSGGAVAQLGRAPVWHTGGRGFESPQLHSPDREPETVGAHIFRNHFGWYMERARAGERFLVTRRGKPYVRLIPADDQPSLQQEPRPAPY